jgi:hypothetical protein
VYGSHKCEFCDGTEGGCPPTKSEITEDLVDRLNYVGVKICGPDIQGFYWYAQDFKGTNERSEGHFGLYEKALEEAVATYLKAA